MMDEQQLKFIEEKAKKLRQHIVKMVVLLVQDTQEVPYLQRIFLSYLFLRK